MRSRLSPPRMEKVLDIASTYSFPPKLLLGIYILETTYRKRHHRIAENSLTVLSIMLHLLFRRKIRNFTIGCCQVGLTTLLSMSGNLRYRHAKHIGELSFKDISTILDGMSFKGSVAACAKWLENAFMKELYRNTSGKENILVRHLGQEYNGRYTYGLLLEDIFYLL